MTTGRINQITILKNNPKMRKAHHGSFGDRLIEIQKVTSVSSEPELGFLHLRNSCPHAIALFEFL